VSKVGKYDLAHAIRQFFDLSGSYAPELGEGIVPTLSLGELEETPFGVAIPWCCRVPSTPAVAAEYSQFVVRAAASLPRGAFISIRTLILSAVAGTPIQIEPVAAVDLTGTTITATAIGVCMRQPNPGLLSRALLPEISITGGSTTLASVGGSTRIITSGSSQVIEGDWAIQAEGALNVQVDTVNVAMVVSALGRLHLTSGR
jgi:hypothetical protein